jgi:acyl-CoA synthetase (AMP-forming)/AMP-acid ligase II
LEDGIMTDVVHVSTGVVRVSDVVRDRAALDPHRLALQDATGMRRVTYGDLWARVERGAAGLRERGLVPGDRVWLALASGPDWMPAFLSISHAGLVAVPIPADTTPGLARLAAIFTAFDWRLPIGRMTSSRRRSAESRG